MIRPGARVRLRNQISFGPGGRMNEKSWISAGTEGEVIARTHSGVYWMVRFGTRTGSCRPEELELLDSWCCLCKPSPECFDKQEHDPMETCPKCIDWAVDLLPHPHPECDEAAIAYMTEEAEATS